jgi:hypothetical protein
MDDPDDQWVCKTASKCADDGAKHVRDCTGVVRS